MRNFFGGRKSGISSSVSVDPVSLLRLFKIHGLDLFHPIFKAFAFCCPLKGFYSDGNEVTYGTPSSCCYCIIWIPEVA